MLEWAAKVPDLVKAAGVATALFFGGAAAASSVITGSNTAIIKTQVAQQAQMDKLSRWVEMLVCLEKADRSDGVLDDNQCFFNIEGF